MGKEAIAFDFDGVIHDIKDGWKNGEIYGAINQEVIETIRELNKMRIPVFIFSTRAPNQIVEALNDLDLGLKFKTIPSGVFFFNDLDYIGVTQRKLPAQLYIDDRAINYTGQSKKDLLMLIIRG